MRNCTNVQIKKKTSDYGYFKQSVELQSTYSLENALSHRANIQQPYSNSHTCAFVLMCPTVGR
jgi:hypothetical protein